jgi:hypothetical protein
MWRRPEADSRLPASTCAIKSAELIGDDCGFDTTTKVTGPRSLGHGGILREQGRT